jgi:hypothetical protein
MPKLRPPRLRYADIVATLALVIALGGTSYAVTALPRNSVGTAQLKTHAVTKSKLALGISKAGPRGPRGAAGIAGPTGLVGAPGPQGVLGVVIVNSGDTAFVPSPATATATCPVNKIVIGGGAFAGGTTPTYVTRSAPSPDGSGWNANSGGSAGSAVEAFAICADRPLIP